MAMLKTQSESTTVPRTIPPRTCKEYDSDDADVVLISSDNYRFRAHSYRLQCFSSVFRSMISMAQSSPQRDPIIFTDEYVECSQIVKMALDIIYTLEVDYLDEQSARSYMFVVDFGKKWDIDLIKSVIGRAIRASLKDDFGSGTVLELMLLAWKMNDNGLASLAFALNPPEWHSIKADTSCNLSMDRTSVYAEGEAKLRLSYQSEDVVPFASGSRSFGGAAFDLGASYHQHFLQIPPTIVWIILRSQHLAAHGKTKAEDHFKRLMDNAYPPSSPADNGKKRKADE